MTGFVAADSTRGTAKAFGSSGPRNRIAPTQSSSVVAYSGIGSVSHRTRHAPATIAARDRIGSRMPKLAAATTTAIAKADARARTTARVAAMRRAVVGRPAAASDRALPVAK